MAISFSGGRSRSNRREPPTMSQQLVNFITGRLRVELSNCQLSQLHMYLYRWSTVTITYVTLQMVNCHNYICTVTNGQLSQLHKYRYKWSTVTIINGWCTTLKKSSIKIKYYNPYSGLRFTCSSKHNSFMIVTILRNNSFMIVTILTNVTLLLLIYTYKTCSDYFFKVVHQPLIIVTVDHL
jgi:hypothetical protein